MYMMAVSAGLIVFQVAREAFGWWHPGGPVDDERLLGVFLSGMTNITAVFLVALLAGYLSEQLRDAGQRLQIASRDIDDLRALNGHIITSIQSGLVSFTLDKRIIFFNPAASRITGLESAEVLYRNVTEVFPVLKLRRPVNSRYRWEGEFQRPGGALRTLGYSLSPLREAGGLQRGWILIFRDLTPLRKMEEDVRRSERFAAIGKMAAGIAHEIRNPLASMSGSIEMLTECVELETTEERLMRIVLREMERLDDLISDFLQFARPSPPQVEALVLRTVFEELLPVFRYLSYTPEDEDEDRPEYKVDLQFDANVTVHADPKQFKQVLWNLLNNAAQSMPEGGPIRLAVEQTEKEIEVSVIDQGVGIANEIIDRIFDPFFSTKEKGTGLGLAQAQRIVDEHDGRLEVESALGEGSVFRVFLPNLTLVGPRETVQ
jgi:two-component system sensor histidine kinase PilS (NtrC family)